MRWSLCIVVCAACCFASAAAAQPVAAEPPPKAWDGADSAPPHEKLRAAKAALERAHFDEASGLLSQVLAETNLSARLRNEAWELLAIVQIAARKERDAKDTLRTLLRRDPEYPRQVSDPGPAVDAAFARARQARPTPVVVPLRYVIDRDGQLRLRLGVDLSEGRDAVESVHVYVGESDGAPLAHLVADVEGERPLSFVLPQIALGSPALTLAIEAQAPSGAVLGRLGERNAPLLAQVPTLPPAPVVSCPAPQKPLRREWWLWTTLGLVVSGFVVASAITAN